LSDSVGATADKLMLASTGRPGRRERIVHALGRLRQIRLPLRRRILWTFALGSFALSAFLAAATYGFTKSALVRQRDRSAIRQAYTNSSTIEKDLESDPSLSQLLQIVSNLDAHAAVLYNGEWVTPAVNFGRAAIPVALQGRVVNELTPSRMITTVEEQKYLAVGIPLETRGAVYVEFVSLEEVESTLSNVARSLVAAGIVTTGLGVLLGALAARRSVRPLGEAAQAAKAIAGGRLDTRLEPTDDPDLALLATAFNDMASALQGRVERDARFASDVSHELRSPLMTLAASAEVLRARRDDMPEKAQAALDLLVADVARFQGLVEDLLEISRFDAGAIRLNLEDLLLAEFVRQAVSVSSQPSTPVIVSERGERLVISGDKRRLARVLANLIDNGRLHGLGDLTIEVGEAHGEPQPLSHAWIAVEDHGAGVPIEERHVIFERFARGGMAGRRSTSDGAGLGLALVDEHVRMHGGRVWVEDRADGEPGARFVIELPAEEVGV